MLHPSLSDAVHEVAENPFQSFERKVLLGDGSSPTHGGGGCFSLLGCEVLLSVPRSRADMSTPGHSHTHACLTTLTVPKDRSHHYPLPRGYVSSHDACNVLVVVLSVRKRKAEVKP